MFCKICRSDISQDRLEALRLLNTSIWDYTCVNCAPNDKIKGIYTGLSGCSPLLFVKKIDDNEGIYPEEQENKQEIIQDISELNEDIAFLRTDEKDIDKSEEIE